jgi:signal transduction histidine kinase
VRVAVLPREIAARVITSAIARGAWAVNATSIALSIPILIEYTVEHGIVGSLAMPLEILVVMLGLAIAAFIVPRPWVVVAYLVLAGAGAVAFELSLIAAHPSIANDGLFLLNRPAVSLVLIGVGATTTRSGITWSAIGFLASTLVTVTVSSIAHLPLSTGWGPVLIFAAYVLAYLLLHAIQASQRRRLPNFDDLERETLRLGAEENLRARVAAAVHDTLLNDLSIVMTAPDELDDRVRARLREDLDTLTSAEWQHESAAVTITDDQDSSLRNQIMLVLSDLQWRGLTVHVTGSGAGIYRVAPDAAIAIVDAIRACLENVLRHAGTTVAEVDLAYTSEDIAIMVSDEGVGFELDSVAADRLGLRQSVVERIRSVNGSVRIWSTPGAGTSVLMRVPVVEVVLEHGQSGHEHPDAATPELDEPEPGVSRHAGG